MKYIISDVHGCYKTLMNLLNKLPKEAKCSQIVFVGDLIDRGPDSRKVIDYVRRGGYDMVIGNHEQLMIEAWDDWIENKVPIDERSMWTANGGNACIRNYIEDGEIDLEALETDVEWLRNLPEIRIYTDEVDEQGRILAVTHAVSIAFIDTYIAKMSEYENIDFETLSIEEEHQITNMSQLLVWNRSIPKTGSKVFFNISGHNIIDHFIFDGMNQLKVSKNNMTPENILVDKELGYACIDTGAFAKEDNYGNLNCNEGKEIDGNPYRGRMTCISFPNLEVFQQCNTEEFNWSN